MSRQTVQEINVNAPSAANSRCDYPSISTAATGHSKIMITGRGGGNYISDERVSIINIQILVWPLICVYPLTIIYLCRAAAQKCHV